MSVYVNGPSAVQCYLEDAALLGLSSLFISVSPGCGVLLSGCFGPQRLLECKQTRVPFINETAAHPAYAAHALFEGL